jgi:hypothetical protein
MKRSDFQDSPSPSSRFTEACGFAMPFGKRKGETLARIGASDEGLRYLDWLVGILEGGIVKGKLEAYLTHPAVKLRLDALLDG